MLKDHLWNIHHNHRNKRYKSKFKNIYNLRFLATSIYFNQRKTGNKKIHEWHKSNDFLKFDRHIQNSFIYKYMFTTIHPRVKPTLRKKLPSIFLLDNGHRGQCASSSVPGKLTNNVCPQVSVSNKSPIWFLP